MRWLESLTPSAFHLRHSRVAVSESTTPLLGSTLREADTTRLDQHGTHPLWARVPVYVDLLRTTDTPRREPRICSTGTSITFYFNLPTPHIEMDCNHVNYSPSCQHHNVPAS